ncbi:ATP-binding cassette domain-containing protein [Pseudohoeflea suaedae]|uniref:ATP-binding cassette domain-containing protein n=1 Tax=Pseudohoeflea suaedae TaxID=877384 RepID=A0A4R5PK07_9HYPH|nr:AAA family ATPase [Pseudohoeflea suaedae]TDH35150.1 ATP-binding cassette domain-containing protein [Pseudohoeflea suaedae]
MRLVSFAAKGYRSLRSVRFDLGQVTVFVGENGAGKSNLYRALQLVKAAAEGHFSTEVVREGGMQSAMWSGNRRKHESARIILEADFEDAQLATRLAYRVEAGLPPPVSGAFPFEPQIKEEHLTLDTGRRPVNLMDRRGPAVFARDGEGRRMEHPALLLTSESGLAVLGQSGHYPEIGDLSAQIRSWRFYHGFRSDRDAPVRQPSIAATAAMLDEDGGNLASVFATLAHIRQDTVDLDRLVADALEGGRLVIPYPDETATFGLNFPAFPPRTFRPGELSDGQIRLLALAGALLSYRLPPLIALNEPEASLHPDMIPSLAGMIAQASERSQIWVVTHSTGLASAIAAHCGTRPIRVRKQDGETVLE